MLHALAEVSNTTTASIKFYRREGLLPAGTRLTATRQDYDHGHVECLQLIRVLREEAGATIPDIRALVTVIDDPRRPLVDALEIAQALGELLEGMRATGSPVDRGRRRPGTSSWPARCGEWSLTIG
ncbi:MerR family transcriptional regulator [Kocuria sp. CPCC 205261]|uniref:MerR family transcriptional regulator n=1 Tax=Kocuria sp. CPCC 205261 TaxID=3073554 RepID=UPI0034D674FA